MHHDLWKIFDRVFSMPNFSLSKPFPITATAQIEAFKLDETTVQVMFEYITTDAIRVENRLAVSLILKNIIKKVYGVSTHSCSH